MTSFNTNLHIQIDILRNIRVTKKCKTSHFHTSLILCPILIIFQQFYLYFIALFINIDVELAWILRFNIEKRSFKFCANDKRT